MRQPNVAHGWPTPASQSHRQSRACPEPRASPRSTHPPPPRPTPDERRHDDPGQDRRPSGEERPAAPRDRQPAGAAGGRAGRADGPAADGQPLGRHERPRRRGRGADSAGEVRLRSSCIQRCARGGVHVCALGPFTPPAPQRPTPPCAPAASCWSWTASAGSCWTAGPCCTTTSCASRVRGGRRAAPKPAAPSTAARLRRRLGVAAQSLSLCTRPPCRPPRVNPPRQATSRSSTARGTGACWRWTTLARASATCTSGSRSRSGAARSAARCTGPWGWRSRCWMPPPTQTSSSRWAAPAFIGWGASATRG
jgi:hypothetical protein